MLNTPQNRERVTLLRNITVYTYPQNWRELPEFQNFRNRQGALCGFVEMDGYLTSTVY